MSHIAVDNLKQGMVLDEDVRDINTRLLLSKGQKLALNHIRILKIWGVAAVSVVGDAQNRCADIPALDDEKLETIRTGINILFKHVDLTNGTLKEICKAALKHRLRGAFVQTPTAICQTGNDYEVLRDSEQIRKQIHKIDAKLPEAPGIIAELNQVIADPFATSNDVARVVNTSPSLAATLLRIVNSAYYGFPSRVDRISRAVTIIGTKEISGLALGLSVMQVFKDIPKNIIDMQAFIRHSLACGMLARILAALNNMAQTEQLFVSGLLHDIGKLIVYKYYPEHATMCMRMADSSDTCVFQSEKKIFGINHPQIAKLLLKKWNLPTDLKNTIAYHHAPGQAPDPEKAAIVHLADIITHGLGIGSSGERSIPCFDSEAVNKIAISTHTIQMVIRQAVHQLGPMDTIFSSLNGDGKE